MRECEKEVGEEEGRAEGGRVDGGRLRKPRDSGGESQPLAVTDYGN